MAHLHYSGSYSDATGSYQVYRMAVLPQDVVDVVPLETAETFWKSANDDSWDPADESSDDIVQLMTMSIADLARAVCAAAGSDRIAQMRLTCAVFQERLTLHVAQDGSVFVFDDEAQDDGARHIPAPQHLCAALAQMQAEDAAELARRDALARETAGGNAVLEQVIRLHLEFRGGVLDEPHIADGVPFYTVGRNASHSFALGVGSDGQRYVASDGPSSMSVDEFAALDADAQRAVVQCFSWPELFPEGEEHASYQRIWDAEREGDHATVVRLLLEHARAREWGIPFDQFRSSPVASWDGCYLGHF
ncbi:MAG: hypothetical protein Q7T01_01050 [bacterium]|nr:hypothetical protein [bacterium]